MITFFVNEARKNDNKFSSTKELNEYLIENYYPVRYGSTHEYLYVFDIYVDKEGKYLSKGSHLKSFFKTKLKPKTV